MIGTVSVAVAKWRANRSGSMVAEVMITFKSGRRGAGV